MKKILTLLLALLLALSLCACGTAPDDGGVDPSADDAQLTEPTDAQEPDGDVGAQSADGDAATQPAVDPKPVADAPTTQQPSQQPSQQPTQQPSQQPAQEEPTTAAPTAADAAAYIGRSTSSLAAAIGQPSGKSYASSCLGEGEDGEWYYDGFTVYTYRDTSGAETVQDVM